MRNFGVPISDEPHDILDTINLVEAGICTQEGLKDMWETTVQRIKIMLGNQDAMAKFVTDNMSKFSDLDEEKLVRTVMPKDLAAAENAGVILNNLLNKATMGNVLDLKKEIPRALNDVGIELREDGVIHHEKFLTGAWGEGKGKTYIAQPLTFKKKIREFGWQTIAPQMASKFVDLVGKLNKSNVEAAIGRHYRDLMRAYATKLEKTQVKVDKKVSLNQVRNILLVRKDVLKMIFKNLERILGAAKRPYDEATKVPNSPTTGADLWT